MPHLLVTRPDPLFINQALLISSLPAHAGRAMAWGAKVAFLPNLLWLLLVRRVGFVPQTNLPTGVGTHSGMLNVSVTLWYI